MSRLDEALTWLAATFSADRDEFRAQFRRGADDLRAGLVAHGFALHDRRQDRYAVSPAGFRRLEEQQGG